jgi:hypothetical protein
VVRSETYSATKDWEIEAAGERQVRKTQMMREHLFTTPLETDEKFDNLLSQLSEVAERVGGEVVSIGYKEETNIPEILHIKIPVKQFGVFHNHLEDLGELQGVPMTITGENKEILLLRIRLLNP